GCPRSPRYTGAAIAAPSETAWATMRTVSGRRNGMSARDRKSTRLNSSHEWISYAVFCLKKKKKVDGFNYRVDDPVEHTRAFSVRSLGAGQDGRILVLACDKDTLRISMVTTPGNTEQATC